MRARQTIVDSIEGFYITLIIDFLHREGILDALTAKDDLASIAASRDFDYDTLAHLLDFVALRSNLVSRVRVGRTVRFAVADAYRPRSFQAHLIDQYVGGFGPCLLDLASVLRNPERGRQLVDATRHAAAYSGGKSTLRQMVQLVASLEIGCLLDVGCGGGQLLADIARERPQFNGIGIDENPEVVESARRSISDEGLADRIAIVHGDLLDVGKNMGPLQRERVDALTAVSVANGFFSSTPGRRIDDFFERLRYSFPNRIMILCDYYGRLGLRFGASRNFRRTLIHDVAQVVSGQGVPPNGLAEWRRIYKRTSCRLVDAFERSDDGISWFIHIIQL